MRALTELWPSLFVFPLHRIDRKSGLPKCTCWRMATDERCTNPGKCPACKFNERDFPMPGYKFQLDQYAGYAIATGYRSGIFVVDIDTAEARQHFYAQGHMPETFTVQRGDSGAKMHLYFQLPYRERPARYIQNSTSTLFKDVGVHGIDIRGDGGFVVGPGSPHKSGDIYRVVNNVLPAPAPDWLLVMPALWGEKGIKSERKVVTRFTSATSRLAPPTDPTLAVAIAPHNDPLGRRYNEERIQNAILYLRDRAPLSIIRFGGRSVFFGVCVVLAVRMRLPFDICGVLIERYYLPRCLKAGSARVWTPQAVQRKLAEADYGSDAELGTVLSFEEWRGLQRFAARITQENP
jgi:Bifunctional DNA primase/polymerase, N-terminal